MIVLLLVAALAANADARMPDGMSATSSVDRPAIWVADRVTYTVDIVCPRGYGILLEDLGREKLRLTGFDAVGSESSRHEDGATTRYVFRYVLTTFALDVPSPSVAPFPVRYYIARDGQRPEESAPAGSLTVPGASVVFRSMLPDDQPADVRDNRAVPPRWLPYRIMGPLGLGLIVASIVPVLLLLLDVARRARERRHQHVRPSARQAKQAARVAFDEIRALDPATPEARRDAFARLDAAVRHHLHDVCGVPAAALAAEEIARSIEPCAGRVPVELATAILDTCERARYAPPALQPADDEWRATLAQAEQVLAGR